eukprot:GHUV01034146.1.p1 GENE.GHUV01034146.1~~GHUV01034146.1.p1  ORF type:complete len:146 (-),score=27.57 GHUV01034146.1:632-1069(-)
MLSIDLHSKNYTENNGSWTIAAASMDSKKCRYTQQFKQETAASMRNDLPNLHDLAYVAAQAQARRVQDSLLHTYLAAWHVGLYLAVVNLGCTFGSYTYSLAPSANKPLQTSIAGVSRVSPVSFLKAKPSTCKQQTQACVNFCVCQ